MHNERGLAKRKLYGENLSAWFYRVGISRLRCSTEVFLVSWTFFAYVWSIEKVVQVEHGALKLSQFMWYNR